jgi:hypothetical protein
MAGVPLSLRLSQWIIGKQRFVPQNNMAISSGRIQMTYDRAIQPHLMDYMGLIFEKMCREYLLYYAKELPIEMSEIGQWWGTDVKTHKAVQIDIVAASAEKTEFIIGSCKFRNQQIGVDELELLHSYADVFGKGKKYYYYIFSKGGFTKNLQQQAELENVTLVSLDDMYPKGITAGDTNEKKQC